MPGLLLKQTTCAVCAQRTTRKCAQCKSIFYCSRAHQRKHWPAHCATCIPAPKRRVIWGLSLPAFHLKPELVPVVVNELGGEPGSHGMSDIELAEHLGGNKHDSRVIPTSSYGEGSTRSEGPIMATKTNLHKLRPKRSTEATKAEPGVDADHFLRVFFRDAFRSDGSPLNRSVRMLCGARLLADGSLNGGDTPLEWCGNLLVVRCMKDNDTERFVSATHSDMEIVREWLGRYQGRIRGRESPMALSGM